MSVFEKLDFKSKDNVTENLIFLNDHFKGVVTETAEGLKINKELLLQKISKELVEGSQEKYELNWPGKRKAQLAANIQTDKTLEPVIEDSVDFENTENLYIEGDNLEVLKILQESYTGKIKCIYIDPPYNTGKDFVYKDSFDQDKKDYLTETNQLDEEGGRLVSNPETSGRYHSNWLSMMYPRLRLARNLLSEDGVIFISIDDNEVHNLRKICDEIYGEDNFICSFIWEKKTAPNNVTLGTVHDYIITYAKEIRNTKLFLLPRSSKKDSGYKNPDNDPRGLWKPDNFSSPAKGGREATSLIYPITNPNTGQVFNPPLGRMWSVNYDNFKKLDSEGLIYWGKDGKSRPMYKRFLLNTRDGMVIPSILKMEFSGSNSIAAKEINEILDSPIFETPKPVKLMDLILRMSIEKNDCILDFFSGSATSAHATMNLNSEDGGNRKYIMVQIPEKTQEDSEAYKAGYKNICEIGKERIIRAAKKIKEETNAEIDYGFRVLKLADSVYNKETFKSPKDTNIDSLFENNLRENITSDSLLFATLLDLGLPLSYKFEIKNIENKKTYFVEENSLICCFENNLDNSFITKLLENNPMYLILLDSSFKSDQDKINIKNKLQELNLRTTIKVI